MEVYKFFNNMYDSATTGWLNDRHMQINYDRLMLCPRKYSWAYVL